MRISANTLLALRELAITEPLALRVAGDCMQPTLHSGDRIRVRRARFYRPGDIVTFRRDDGRLLVHRVLGYTLGRYGIALLARGDRLSREDEPVGLDRIIGRVIECEGRRVATGWGQGLRCAAEFAATLLRRSLRSWVSAPSS